MSEQESDVRRIDVSWEGERRFRMGAPGGPTLVVDGGRESAPSPVESMVGALAACSAIDVLEILAKRRTPAESLRVEVEYTRAPSAPRRLTAALLRFRVATASDPSHVERAVTLSVESYCSVAASLRADIPLSWRVEVVPPEEARDG
jgi:putative redox protein